MKVFGVKQFAINILIICAYLWFIKQRSFISLGWFVSWNAKASIESVISFICHEISFFDKIVSPLTFQTKLISCWTSCSTTGSHFFIFFPYDTQFISICNILIHTCFNINTTASSSNSAWIFVINAIWISLWNISGSNFMTALIIGQITLIHNLILINLKILTNLTLGNKLLFFGLFDIRYDALINFWFIIFWGCVITLLLSETCTFETLSDCRLTGLIKLILLFIQNHWVINLIIFLTVFLVDMICLRRWILFSIRFNLFFSFVDLLIGNNI